MIIETLVYKYKCSKCGYVWILEERDTNPRCFNCCLEPVPDENNKVNNSKEIGLMNEITFQAG